MFLLSFVKGSKSAEGGPNPLADMDPGGPILGGSKSARTPADFPPFRVLGFGPIFRRYGL